jgi:hypothetical protein
MANSDTLFELGHRNEDRSPLWGFTDACDLICDLICDFFMILDTHD